MPEPSTAASRRISGLVVNLTRRCQMRFNGCNVESSFMFELKKFFSNETEWCCYHCWQVLNGEDDPKPDVKLVMRGADADDGIEALL